MYKVNGYQEAQKTDTMHNFTSSTSHYCNFLHLQSTCQLSMFRIPGTTPSDISLLVLPHLLYNLSSVRFLVFTVMKMHVMVFWVVMPCSNVVG